MLADMAIGVEAARALTWRAVWEIEQGGSANYMVSIAKTFASEVANRAAADAVQVTLPLPVPLPLHNFPISLVIFEKQRKSGRKGRRA